MPKYIELNAFVDLHSTGGICISPAQESEKEKKEPSPKNRADSEKNNISVKERISK